jgi:hypothetical protein
MTEHIDGSLIDELGGTRRVASMCGISVQAVWQWRRDGIPELRRLQIARELRRLGKPIPPALEEDAA